MHAFYVCVQYVCVQYVCVQYVLIKRQRFKFKRITSDAEGPPGMQDLHHTLRKTRQDISEVELKKKEKR